MRLHLINHGSQDNDSEAPETGVEALLDLQKISLIHHYAASLHKLQDQLFFVETTPVARALVTGKIIAEELTKAGFPVKHTIHELIGSYAQQDTKVINLSPFSMQQKWAEAKKVDGYHRLEGKHQPLYAWCEQGFDNRQARNPQDPGISLREIACRVGTYVYQRLQQAHGSDQIIAIGHSGDIEPFLYLTLEMLQGKNGSAFDALTYNFERTGGALEPLQGVVITNREENLYLTHLAGNAEHKVYQHKLMGMEIFFEQARWFTDHGRSQEVLEQKTR